MPFPSLNIRDVLHGYIPLDENDRALLDCTLVQRLRHIKQNDIASLVYPSLNTSRFEHSLGVMHVATQLSEWALNNAKPSHQKKYLKQFLAVLPTTISRPRTLNAAGKCFVRASRWYGLLHDLGHLPLSHLTEQALERSFSVSTLYPGSNFSKLHEAAAFTLVTTNDELKSALRSEPTVAWVVERLLASKDADPPVLQPIKDIIDGDVDADRIDAIARDGLLSGGDYGHYDIRRLTQSAVLSEFEGKWRVSFTTKAISSIESLLVERLKTYRWIHYHHKVVVLKNAYRLCISGLKWKHKKWHCSKYATDEGFLDDARVLNAIWKFSPREDHLKHARMAVLLRKKTAYPLWKRRDEFRNLSAKVAAHKLAWKTSDKEKPMLNKLVTEAATFEKALNESPPDGVYYLVSKTMLDPFEPSNKSINSEGSAIGEYRIIEHKTKKHELLTNESRLVQGLSDVVAREPAFAVTVLSREGRSIKDVNAHFLSKAIAHLDTMLAPLRIPNRPRQLE